jgi:hypothetical protein
MKRRVSYRSVLARPAGLWLRCFLSGTLAMLLCLAGAGVAKAQVDIPGPERLTHIEGIVVNSSGHPAADLAVTLLRDDKVAYRTQTDKSGGFNFEHVAAGPYVFRVERSKDAPAERQIVVTDEIVTVLQRKKLYILLGPGACQDACSAMFTSKKDFDKAVRKNNRH